MKQIIKQPNGKYLIFSSVVDNVIMYDATKEDIINEWVKESREKITRDVNNIIERLGDDDYEEVFKIIKNVHGKEEVEKVKKLFYASIEFKS